MDIFVIAAILTLTITGSFEIDIKLFPFFPYLYSLEFMPKSPLELIGYRPKWTR